MSSAIRRRVSRKGLENVRTLLGYSNDPNLPAGAFDAVLVVDVYPEIEDRVTFLKNASRALKPNGRVVLFDYNARTQRRLARLYGHPLPCWSQWQLKRLVSAAGFESAEMLMPTQHVPSLPEFWLRYVHQQLLSDWAIVTGIKPATALPRSRQKCP